MRFNKSGVVQLKKKAIHIFNVRIETSLEIIAIFITPDITLTLTFSLPRIHTSTEPKNSVRV